MVEDELRGTWCATCIHKDVCLTALESAQPDLEGPECLCYWPGWIPCSERLPEEAEDVLCWIERDSLVDGKYYLDRKQEFDIGWHIGGRWHFDGLAPNTDCLAWTRLPDPYKEIKS